MPTELNRTIEQETRYVETDDERVAPGAMTIDVDSGTTDRATLNLRRVLLVVGVAVLLGLVPFVSGLIGALMLYAITRRLYDRLAVAFPPRLAAFAIVFGVLFLILIPGTWLVSTIVSEGGDAIRSWSTSDAATWLSTTPLAGSDVTKNVAAATTGLLGWLSSRAFAVFGSVASTVLNLAISLFGLYYLLLGATPLWRRVKSLIPLPPDVSDDLAARFADVTEALLVGTFLTAVLQGSLVGVGFAIVGLRPPVLWGFVTACVSVLPLFGSSLVWLPGTVILLFEHRIGAAVFLTVLGAGLVSNLDNVVRLFVYRRVSGIHPMLTLIGAFAGVRLFGVIGAFLGPLALSYFFELLRIYEEMKAVRRASA